MSLLYKIIRAKSALAGGMFFILVFIFGLLWASGKFGGAADAFIFNNALN